MPPYLSFDIDSAGDLPDCSYNADNLSDTDSLLANDGYSDTEEGDTHEDHVMDGPGTSLPMIRTMRDEYDSPPESSTPGAAYFEANESLAAHDFDPTRIEHFLSQFPTPPSDLGAHHDFTGTASRDKLQFLESVENIIAGLKRKRQEHTEELRFLKSKIQYDDMVLAQTVLGIDGDDSMISMDMFDAEHQQRYFDEQEMYYDDADMDLSLIPSLEDADDAPPAAAEAAFQEDGSPKDSENKKVDKGKGKAVDKGKGKTRSKGKGKARVSPYDITSGRTHREDDERIPRLELSRADWLSSIMHQPMSFDHLFEGRNELAQYGDAAYIGGYGHGGMSVTGGSGYSGMPIASGSGTHRDD